MANLFDVVKAELDEITNTWENDRIAAELAERKIKALARAIYKSKMFEMMLEVYGREPAQLMVASISFGMQVQKKISNPDKPLSYLESELDIYEIATGVKDAHSENENSSKIPPTI